MRKAFFEALADLADKDTRIFLLTADIGYGVIEPFAQRHPSRFINAGVAEQNMVGVATGLAEAGFIPFCYSITPFIVLRPYEFIRNGPVLHNLPVRIVGAGKEQEYGVNGPTHWAMEDKAVMEALHVRTIEPETAEAAQEALRTLYALPEPLYFRISKNATVK